MGDMRPGKDLIGKPIYSMDDGQHLGTVKDLYLDLDLGALTGLFLGHEGLISRKPRLITGDNIAVLGQDAILAKDAFAVVDNITIPEVENWIRRETVQGRQINTPGGTRVGTIADVLLNKKGQILALSLDKVYVEGPVAEKGAIARSAIIETGGREGVMTLDLSKAERPEMAEGTKDGPVQGGKVDEPAQDDDSGASEGLIDSSQTP